MSLETYFGQLKSLLSPLLSYYNKLSEREQLLLKLGTCAILIYGLVYFVLTPYMAYRTEIIAARASAYEEYTWLAAQEARVNEALQSSGVAFGDLLNVEELVLSHVPAGEVTLLENGDYLVRLQAIEGVLFFNAISALVNRGGTVLSLDFERPADGPNSIYTARVRI